jgi:hypothetical protein
VVVVEPLYRGLARVATIPCGCRRTQKHTLHLSHPNHTHQTIKKPLPVYLPLRASAFLNGSKGDNYKGLPLNIRFQVNNLFSGKDDNHKGLSLRGRGSANKLLPKDAEYVLMIVALNFQKWRILLLNLLKEQK